VNPKVQASFDNGSREDAIGIRLSAFLKTCEEFDIAIPSEKETRETIRGRNIGKTRGKQYFNVNAVFQTIDRCRNGGGTTKCEAAVIVRRNVFSEEMLSVF
jgi:hypothetical protein